MHVNAEIDTNGDMLKRIIALLLALAGVAEDAARLPYPVRLFLLRILRWAEPFGRRVVAREANYLRVAPWLMSSAEAHGGNTPADAMSVALCFRLLALALANLSVLARRFVRRICEDTARNIQPLADRLTIRIPLGAQESPRLDSS